jgi:CheY-like chemotaxis protein
MEVCRRLKADFPDVPVVLMSGWATGVNPAEARRAGARALLAKPFAMQQVTELVATILKPVEPGHMN